LHSGRIDFGSGALRRCASARCAGDEKSRLFQGAVASYEAGRYAEAVGPLEKLVGEVPENFEVQELLGLVYAAQSQQSKGERAPGCSGEIEAGLGGGKVELGGKLCGVGKFDLAVEQFALAEELEQEILIPTIIWGRRTFTGERSRRPSVSGESAADQSRGV